MGYNQENYRRIRIEYETKYLDARAAAEARRAEVHATLPEVEQLDREMNGLGLEIMRLALSGEYTEEKLAALREKNQQLRCRRSILMVTGGFPADYTDVRYECNDCADTGFVDCKMCHCMRNKLILAGYESSGVANLLRTQTFGNYSLDYFGYDPKVLAHMTRLVDHMKRYADTFSPGVSGNLVLFGGTGLGKTHLSTAVAGVVIEKGCDVYYTSAVGLIADFEQARFGNTSGTGNGVNTDRYQECDLLIIDDLGTEVNNQFTTSVLYDIINTRLVRRKSTIISTNLSSDEFRARYWDRITSRVLGEYTVLPFWGTDVRNQRLKRK